MVFYVSSNDSRQKQLYSKNYINILVGYFYMNQWFYLKNFKMNLIEWLIRLFKLKWVYNTFISDKSISGITNHFSCDYLVHSVDGEPMEEIWVYQTWKTLEYAV